MVDVLVVGAGVAGLTSAVRLAEAGLTVRVVAADPPERTTSAVAGACWGPDLVSDPRGPVWSETSRRVFIELAEDPDSGVHLAAGVQAVPAPLVPPTPISIPDVASAVPKPPAWVSALPDFHRCGLGELPSGYITGWRYTTPLIDMPKFLAYLVSRLAAAGVSVEAGRIGGFAELAGAAGTVVNCTGLAARELVPDGEFAPTRGQLVVVDNPGIRDFFIEFDEDPVMTYFFPHGDHVILGGTAIAGWEDLTPDPATAAAIVKRCAAIEPSLRDANVREHRVGLRPMRTSVRVERDPASAIVHNYGHGGAGVTLSWGCADDVVTLVTT